MQLFDYLAITPLIILSVLSLVYAVVYSYFLKPHHGDIQANVTLIMAVTGHSIYFKDLLIQLNSQELKPSRLVIGIESKTDPAYQQIMDLAKFADFPIQLIVAGLATTSSQKCHNLLAVFDALNPSQVRSEYIVFCDADIHPPTWWLSALIKPLANQSADLVSGYRWQQVQHNTLAAHLTAFLDHKIALLPRPLSADIIWGGSVAMSFEVFQSVVEAGIFKHTLSDDLALASYARIKKYRVLNRRVLLVPSTVPESIVSAWRFGVRQFQIIKIYRPKIWCLAFFASSVRSIGWIALGVSCINEAQALWIVFFIILLSILESLYQHKITHILGFKTSTQYRLYQLILCFAKPLTDLYQQLVLIASIRSRRVRWGHVDYVVQDKCDITIEKRRRVTN